MGRQQAGFASRLPCLSGDAGDQAAWAASAKRIARIVAGCPRDFTPKRAIELGFRAESSFDEIIKIHIEYELGGKI